MSINIGYFKTTSGRIPVMEFIDSLDVIQKAKLIHVIQLLEEFGISLTLPHAKQIESKLWELRASAERIIYFIFSKEKAILLHGFTKKRDKIPYKEITIAKKRYLELMERYKNDI
ncbi:MAG: hypothetical protein A2X61_10260 [Ignavibacteria bacterium GWB2_35_12]|nr:MAG: hypothetical protein A2X61_10260 [Ignavibacteria bacterium GWB2_35_12]OGU91227.1 MAG: hypothetical protein A2220_16485 [Ignavibacteria bacterium RIFOXYA2_FULL_35_10]OGV21362.1 MAG: hypothetical protein A2475_15020 [Ignavibacteria bacterium RIFOXYC2_FULL_35_21]